MTEERDGLMTPKQQKFADLMWDNTGLWNWQTAGLLKPVMI